MRSPLLPVNPTFHCLFPIASFLGTLGRIAGCLADKGETDVEMGSNFSRYRFDCGRPGIYWHRRHIHGYRQDAVLHFHHYLRRTPAGGAFRRPQGQRRLMVFVT